MVVVLVLSFSLQEQLISQAHGVSLLNQSSAGKEVHILRCFHKLLSRLNESLKKKKKELLPQN